MSFINIIKNRGPRIDPWGTPALPPLIMNNTIINQVTEHKHLGLDISNDGSWQKHIDLITKKAFIRGADEGVC
jgi:hypothetical protein